MAPQELSHIWVHVATVESSWMNTINSVIHGRGSAGTGLLFIVYLLECGVVMLLWSERVDLLKSLSVHTDQSLTARLGLIHWKEKLDIQLFPNMASLVLYCGNQNGLAQDFWLILYEDQQSVLKVWKLRHFSVWKNLGSLFYRNIIPIFVLWTLVSERNAIIPV